MYASDYASSGLGSAAGESYLLLEGFYTIFHDELDEEPSVFDQIFAVKETSKRSETAFEFNGLTMAVQTAHGGPTLFEDPSSGNKKELTPLLYRKGFRVTEEDLEDDLYGLLKEVAASLPRCMTRRVEAVCGSTVSGVFSTTTGFDGLSLANSAHTYAAGYNDAVVASATTQSNVLDTAGPPSPENCQSMWVKMRKQKTREGFPARLKGDTWVVNVDKEAALWEVLNSMQVAQSNDNTSNIFKSAWTGSRVVCYEWLTTANEWHLIDSNHSPFLLLWRVKPQFKNQVAMNNWVKEYYARMRFVAGAFDWRGLVSTSG